jgi:hypothetical protein
MDILAERLSGLPLDRQDLEPIFETDNGQKVRLAWATGSAQIGLPL